MSASHRNVSRPLLLLIALAASAASCGPRAQQGHSTGPIVVAAAISLKNAFLDIARQFTARTGVRVNFSFGASGELVEQMRAGAPVDVFASAGEPEMNELQQANLIAPSSRSDFAGNTLALILPDHSPLACKDVRCLLRPEFKRIGMGDPKTVPAGMYAEQMLRHVGLWTRLKPRLIFAENVRQALTYVARGEVDAGIVYSTDIPIAHGRVTEAAQAPKGSYGPVRYPIAVLRDAPHPEAAQAFLTFVLSSAGQEMLRHYGFLPLQPS